MRNLAVPTPSMIRSGARPAAERVGARRSRKHRRVGSALALGLLLWLGGCGTGVDMTPVEPFDARQYAGTWHEVASIPHFFQRNCVRDTRATYTLDADHPTWIDIDNVCTHDDGRKEHALGRARPAGGPPASRLEVTFLRLFDEYRFWFAFDYWVIALDPAYRWAVVGHPSHRYGWVLAREPRVAPEVLAEIIGRIKAQGYDACQFVVTPQTGGLSVRRPLCEALP